MINTTPTSYIFPETAALFGVLSAVEDSDQTLNISVDVLFGMYNIMGGWAAIRRPVRR